MRPLVNHVVMTMMGVVENVLDTAYFDKPEGISPEAWLGLFADLRREALAAMVDAALLPTFLEG